MNLVTKTIYYDTLILSHFRNKNFKPLPNTTLNEKFSINKDLTIEVETPTLKYFAIGNGNLKTIDAEENMKLYHGNHRCIDAALFNHIPFVLRKEGEDIDIDARKKYRLRKYMTINNENYIAYYLKVIPDDMIQNQIIKITQETDTMPKIEPFNTNDSTLLNPEPYANTITEIINNYTEFVTNSDQISLILTVEEMTEVKNAMLILNIPIEDRIINEICLCSGTDIVDLSTYEVEVAYSQVMFFLDVDYDIQLLLSNNEEFFRQVEIGGMQALMLG